jgi:hypothetical protein
MKNGFNATTERAASRKNGHHRFEYQIIAESILGRPLKRGEVIHHVDLNPRNNENGNLVICTQSYHRLIHARKTAYDATGNANAKKCTYCQQWDLPERMVPHKAGTSTMRHRSCFYGKGVAW